MIKFMERTIASHVLTTLTYDTAACFTPGFVNNYFEAERLAKNTNYFERRNILVADKDYVWPPIESYLKSFEKWLAIQKHDVRAVNSLHSWRADIRSKKNDLSYKIFKLQMNNTVPALKKYFDARLKKLNREYRELAQLEMDLTATMAAIRRGERKEGQVA